MLLSGSKRNSHHLAAFYEDKMRVLDGRERMFPTLK
jgi:hypothetical protein